MTKGQLAKNYFTSGLNCAQAVALSFKEQMNLSEEQIEKATIGLGGGLARLRLTCGVVSGMAIVLGNVFFDRGKTEVYKIIQSACEKFKKETGSLICGELLVGVTKDNSPIPSDRTPEYYKKRPCAELCELGADIVAQTIDEYK